jgi:hypothetical protein
VNIRRSTLALAFAFALALAGTAFAGSSAPVGTWARLPTAPITPNDVGLTSAWTGTRMLVVARQTRRAKDGAVLAREEVAASFDPATRTWQRLPAPPSRGDFAGYSSAWTGRELLVWGQGMRAAFDPAANRWRALPSSPLLSVHDGFGLVAWTGRELIGWGGGCCGDAFSDGVAYDAATNRWRPLAPSPLAGSQHPIGAWTGRELIVLVGRLDPNGKPWPRRLARAAAYDPARNTWRRIAPLPSARDGATAVWDGRELLVVGGLGPGTHASFAFDPKTNRWRRLAPMPSGRVGFATVWTGRRLLVWGGTTRAGSLATPRTGLALDPRANRWSIIPPAPVRGRLGPAAVWTGRSLVVWSGTSPFGIHDGASFTPVDDG